MGLVNRAATSAEIEKMRMIARQAMLDGAFGVTTGLFYVPGNFTPTEEVIEIEKVVGIRAKPVDLTVMQSGKGFSASYAGRRKYFPLSLIERCGTKHRIDIVARTSRPATT